MELKRTNASPIHLRNVVVICPFICDDPNLCYCIIHVGFQVAFHYWVDVDLFRLVRRYHTRLASRITLSVRLVTSAMLVIGTLVNSYTPSSTTRSCAEGGQWGGTACTSTSSKGRHEVTSLRGLLRRGLPFFPIFVSESTRQRTQKHLTCSRAGAGLIITAAAQRKC